MNNQDDPAILKIKTLPNILNIMKSFDKISDMLYKKETETAIEIAEDIIIQTFRSKSIMLAQLPKLAKHVSYFKKTPLTGELLNTLGFNLEALYNIDYTNCFSITEPVNQAAKEIADEFFEQYLEIFKEVPYIKSEYDITNQRFTMKFLDPKGIILILTIFSSRFLVKLTEATRLSKKEPSK